MEREVWGAYSGEQAENMWSQMGVSMCSVVIMGRKEDICTGCGLPGIALLPELFCIGNWNVPVIAKYLPPCLKRAL